MSDLGKDVAKAAIMGAVGIVTDLVADKIQSQRELARRHLEQASSTGVALSELWEDLQAVDAARAERTLREVQMANYGRSEGDDG